VNAWVGVALVLAAQALVPAGPFTELAHDDGVVVRTRPIAGTGFLEFEASVELPIAADDALALLWNDREHAASVTVSERLEEGPDRRVIYEVAKGPIVDPRDYVLESTRHPSERAIRFRTIVDPRRPPREGHVRIPRIVGSTVVVPIGETRCRVIHTVFSETGGNVPAWLATAGQRDNMVGSMKALRARAAARR